MAWERDPAGWLRDALAMLALQWAPRSRTLLFDGEGLGLGWACAAPRRLFQGDDARAAGDLVAGTLHAFHLAYVDRLGPDGGATIVTLVERRRAALPTVMPPHDLAVRSPPGILLPTGQKPRPPPLQN